MASTCVTDSRHEVQKHLPMLHSCKSDRQIVKTGALVSRNRKPDRFYQGWYPVRQCPDSLMSLPAAGIKSEKHTSFQHYHVMCDICDAPSSKTRKSSKGHRRRSSDKAPCPPNVSVQNRCQPSQRQFIGNHYWRLHDPHMWMNRPKIDEDCRVHKNNWFVDHINVIVANNVEKKKFKDLEAEKKAAHNSRKKVGDFRSMNFFKDQQKVQGETTAAKTPKRPSASNRVADCKKPAPDANDVQPRVSVEQPVKTES